MKLRIFIPLLILSFCVFYINGYIALIGFFISGFLFKRNINSDLFFLYLPVFLLSAVLTLLPLIYRLTDFNINDSVNIQLAALYQVSQTNINDCSQLVDNDYGRFIKMKESVISYCGIQYVNDVSYFTSGVINAMYSVLYNEFSLASAFIATSERKNQCQESVDQFLTMCPERRVYFDQRSLHALHDFERKQ